MIQSDARMASKSVSLRIVVCPPRSLSVPQQFLKVVAVFWARHRVHHHPCLPPASSGTPRLLSILSIATPPSFLRPRPPAEFLWKLSDIHICPLLHQKFQARPAQPARVLSLSYKGFAATYNISSSPLFPCHFALSRHPPPPIYPLTLLIISSVLSLFLFLSLFRSS